MIIFNNLVFPNDYAWAYWPMGILFLVGAAGMLWHLEREDRWSKARARFVKGASTAALLGCAGAFCVAVGLPLTQLLDQSTAIAKQAQQVVAKDYGQKISFDEAYGLTSSNSAVDLSEGRVLTVGERKVHDRTLVLKLRVTR